MKAKVKVKSKKNYRLLSEYLEEIGIHVVNDSEDCDIFIVDLPSFDEEEILELKKNSHPTFLPVLLLTTREDVGLATKHLWKVIDDIIKIPIEKLELAAKIVTLVRAREYSIKLKEALEAVKIVSSIIRHDILNDLTVAIGYLEIGENTKVLDKLKHIAERLDKFRRYEKLAEIRDLRCISLKDAIEDSRRLKPDLVVDVGDGHVLADNMLSAVIYNIVSNAIKHCGPDVNVKIDAKERGDSVEIRIIDNGKGIPDEIKEKVFDEGFKHESTGSGLGLFLAKKVIERYGGKITVEDNEPRGTVFKIILKKC